MIALKLKHAAELLAESDPRGWARLERNVDRVSVWGQVGWFRWDRRYRTLGLDQAHLIQEWVAGEVLALQLLYAATFAWLWQTKVEDARERIDVLCRISQLQSARRWASPAIVEALESFEQERPLSDWEHGLRSIEKLQHTGAPRWFIWISERVIRWKMRNTMH